MAQQLEVSKELLTTLATISAGAGALLIKVVEKLVDVYSKNAGKTSNETTSHSCKQEAAVAGIGVSVGIYGRRIEAVEAELAKMREHSREDNQLHNEELGKLRLAISEVKDIVRSVEVTIAQVTTVIEMLEENEK